MSDTDHAEHGPWHRVRVGSRAGGTDELVRGHDRDEAMAAAEQTWPHSTVTYVGVDDAFAADAGADDDTVVCQYTSETWPDWWGADYPTMQEPCIREPSDVQAAGR